MCNECCKEFTGWCKAFTKTELFLCVLQAIFLVVFIAFLTFVILHLVVCSNNKSIEEGPTQIESNASSIQTTENINNDKDDKETKRSTEQITTEMPTITRKLDKAITCTWRPSQKTIALTHYYENSKFQYMTTFTDKAVVKNEDTQNDNDQFVFEKNIQPVLEDNNLLHESTDGNELQDSRKDILLALVKLKAPQDITYGCTLTIISKYWTLTAASCIEAIEEVDSLDSFIMMRGFKEEKQNIHPVAGVMIHPEYQGVNITYDVAALKSEDSLVNEGVLIVTLPSMVDYFLITIAETFVILGYGRFRNIDKHPLTRSVRIVSVHSLPLAQCQLTGGTPVAHGACGTSPLCAGVLHSRTDPCNYCSGTPLLKQNVLLGIMSDNHQCGLSCEPVLYVNLALVKEWIYSVLSN